MCLAHYIDERIGLSIGWTCHKDSFSDCLPIWNESRDVCLIFWGQDFGDREGHGVAGVQRLASESKSARQLVYLYEKFGIAFLEALNGWFSGVLADFRKNEVFLFNDRYGLQRTYYHENGSKLLLLVRG